MIAQTPWLDRDFTFNQAIGAFPPLIERLRGTPGRAKEFVAGLSEGLLAAPVGGKWSVKEHLGHIADLQPLDDRRLSEFLNHAEVLSSADIENRATERANHGIVPIAEIIRRLAARRKEPILRLEVLSQEEVSTCALHPRLQKPMRLMDWIYSLAEHDDHHLALARAVISKLQNQPSYPER
jgi:hypothetical protein